MGADCGRIGRLGRLAMGLMLVGLPLFLHPLINQYSARSLDEHYEQENRVATAAARVIYEANGWLGMNEAPTCCGPNGAWIFCDDMPVDEQEAAADAAHVIP